MKFRDLLAGKQDYTVLVQESQKDKTVKLDESVQQSLQNIVNVLTYAGNVTQIAHWNLRSTSFIALHPWFGETYSALFSMADEVAEQIKISDINLMVDISWGSAIALTDEQELFSVVKNSLIAVKNNLDNAANDSSLSRPLQNLIDGWTSEITKMIWFIEASQTSVITNTYKGN